MIKLRRWMADRPAAWALLGSLACLGALVLLHRALHDAGAIRALYLVPIWLATRNGGRAAGLAMVGLTVLMDLTAEGQLAWLHPSAEAAREAVLLVVALGIVTLLVAKYEGSFSQVRRLAMLDPLTGLLNRRALGEFASQVFGETRVTEERLTVVVIDCDGFKTLNDTYGHKAGDHVLQMLARILEFETRKNDLVARVGGDEFVIVFQDADPREAHGIMDRIEGVFERQVRNAGYECTLSVGYAPMEQEARTIDALLDAADRAMYARKEHKKATAYLN